MLDILDEVARGAAPRPADEDLEATAATTLKLNNNSLSILAQMGSILVSH